MKICLTQFSIVNEVTGISSPIESSESWFAGKIDSKKLKAILLSECDVSLETVEENVNSILYSWLTQTGPYATTDKFDAALDFLGCGEVKG